MIPILALLVFMIVVGVQQYLLIRLERCVNRLESRLDTANIVLTREWLDDMHAFMVGRISRDLTIDEDDDDDDPATRH